MAQHKWIKHTVEPITIVDFEGDEPEMFNDPDRKTETVYGCDICGSLLTTESAKTDCSGEDSQPLVLDAVSTTTAEAVMIDTYADSDD